MLEGGWLDRVSSEGVVVVAQYRRRRESRRVLSTCPIQCQIIVERHSNASLATLRELNVSDAVYSTASPSYARLIYLKPDPRHTRTNEASTCRAANQDISKLILSMRTSFDKRTY